MREYSPFEGGIFMMGVPSSLVGALLWEVHLKHDGALMEEVTPYCSAFLKGVVVVVKVEHPTSSYGLLLSFSCNSPFSFSYERKGWVSS